MADHSEFRAAQYVRMSTEHQQYSTNNQADKILEYAQRRNIEIVRTYADEGKSGLSLGGRASLQKLIASCWENQPQDRPSAEEVLARMEGVARELAGPEYSQQERYVCYLNCFIFFTLGTLQCREVLQVEVTYI